MFLKRDSLLPLSGDLIPGTYCSRIFSDCDKKACRLQSPNFPGVYPRNLTCYYAVRQHEVPTGKHALIIMRQPKGNLVWINSETQASIKSKSDKDKFVPKIQTWDECDNVQVISCLFLSLTHNHHPSYPLFKLYYNKFVPHQKLFF